MDPLPEIAATITADEWRSVGTSPLTQFARRVAEDERRKRGVDFMSAARETYWWSDADWGHVRQDLDRTPQPRPDVMLWGTTSATVPVELVAPPCRIDRMLGVDPLDPAVRLIRERRPRDTLGGRLAWHGDVGHHCT